MSAASEAHAVENVEIVPYYPASLNVHLNLNVHSIIGKTDDKTKLQIIRWCIEESREGFIGQARALVNDETWNE